MRRTRVLLVLMGLTLSGPVIAGPVIADPGSTGTIHIVGQVVEPPCSFDTDRSPARLRSVCPRPAWGDVRWTDLRSGGTSDPTAFGPRSTTWALPDRPDHGPMLVTVTYR